MPCLGDTDRAAWRSLEPPRIITTSDSGNSFVGHDRDPGRRSRFELTGELFPCVFLGTRVRAEFFTFFSLRGTCGRRRRGCNSDRGHAASTLADCRRDDHSTGGGDRGDSPRVFFSRMLFWGGMRLALGDCVSVQ